MIRMSFCEKHDNDFFISMGCESCEWDNLKEDHKNMKLALEVIADPRRRHKEPDKYTELGCVMNIADQALQALRVKE